MPKRAFNAKRFFIALSAAIAVMLFAAVVIADESRADKMSVAGEVTFVSTAHVIFTIKEDKTDKEYRLKSDTKTLKSLRVQKGYRVEVEKSGERATYVPVLGTPIESEPFPHQIIRVEGKV